MFDLTSILTGVGVEWVGALSALSPRASPSAAVGRHFLRSVEHGVSVSLREARRHALAALIYSERDKSFPFLYGNSRGTSITESQGILCPLFPQEVPYFLRSSDKSTFAAESEPGTSVTSWEQADS